MNFIKYQSKQEFLDKNLEILLKEEAKNEIMIGIILEHSEEKVNNWLLARIENNNKVEAIFIVDDDKQGLLLYVPDKLLKDETANFLVDNIIKLNVELKEILTTKENSKMIAKIYGEKANKKIQEYENTYIFRFDKFNEEHILNLGEKIEKIESYNNLDILKELVKEMYLYTYCVKDCSEERAENVVKIFIKKGLYVLKNPNGDIVCQAVTVRKQINGCAIGGVITLKKHRGNGYAKRCVYALCEKLLKQGYKFVVLHVDSKNEIAISVYNKIGFVQIDETEKILFI